MMDLAGSRPCETVRAFQRTRIRVEVKLIVSATMDLAHVHHDLAFIIGGTVDLRMPLLAFRNTDTSIEGRQLSNDRAQGANEHESILH